MNNIELNIIALNASTTSAGNFVLVLQEIKGSRQLAVIIGLQEAQFIALALEQMQPPRPLTHELFLKSIALLNASLEYVKICSMNNDIFVSMIVLKNSDKQLIEIDSRTSDALTLAIRQNCSIYISEHLLSEFAIKAPAEDKIVSEKRIRFEQYNLDKLYEILTNLLQEEDYETAGIVRDIISGKELRS